MSRQRTRCTGGGTELLPALEHVLKVIEQRSRSRRVVIVLITDGQVGNEAEVLTLMKQHASRRVFTFGIDTVVNDAFLRSLAKQQRGACHLATPDDDLVSPVAGLAMKLRRPVLIDLTPGAGWEMPAALPPDLLAGEALSIPLRRTEGAAPLRITARRADGERLTLEFQPQQEPGSGIGRLWAKQRIESLLEAGLKDEALTLAKAANLICEGASFIAWDETERIAIPGSAVPVYQPALEPEAWVCGGAAPSDAMGNARFLHTDWAMTCAVPAPMPKAASSRKESLLSRLLGGSDANAADDSRMAEVSGEILPVSSVRPGTAPGRNLQRLMALSPAGGTPWSSDLGEWLEQWILSDPGLAADRTAEINQLIVELTKLPDDQRTAFLTAWLARVFAAQPAFLRGCLAAVTGGS